MTLTLTLSPGFALARDGEPVTLSNRKAQALLVYLALTGLPRSREHLATLLWGDRMDEQARGSLRQALFALRKAVGEGVLVGDDTLTLAEGALVVDRTGPLLPDFRSGAEDFDRWLEAMRQEEDGSEQDAFEGFRANILLAPLEDLGGGDLAGFAARECQTEMELKLRTFGAVVSMPPASLVLGSNRDMELLDHARNVGAQCVSTGSVRQLGDQVRVTLRVLSAEKGEVRSTLRATIREENLLSGISQLCIEGARKAYEHIVDRHRLDDLMELTKSYLQDEEAFRTAWQGTFWNLFFRKQTRAYNARIKELCTAAHDRFPNDTFLSVTLASAQFHGAHLGDGKDRVTVYRAARQTLGKALAREPDSAMVLMAQMILDTWTGDFAGADRAYQMILDNDVQGFAIAGLRTTWLVLQGRYEEVLAARAQVTHNESGTPPLFYRFAMQSLAHFGLHECREAEEAAAAGLEVGDEFFLNHIVRIAALHRVGRSDQAGEALAHFRHCYRDPTVEEFAFLPWQDARAKGDLLDALREAGLPA